MTTDNALLATAIASAADRRSHGDVAAINAATAALTQISVTPDEPVTAESYQQMVDACAVLASELGKVVTWTRQGWSGSGPMPIAVWPGPEYVGTAVVEFMGHPSSILVRLRAEVARRRADAQYLQAAAAQSARDSEQVAEGRRMEARQVLDASGYGDELAALRSEVALLRSQVSGLISELRERRPAPLPYQPDRPASDGAAAVHYADLVPAPPAPAPVAIDDTVPVPLHVQMALAEQAAGDGPSIGDLRAAQEAVVARHVS